ncbi:DUF3293 domain-containing protein [Trinickia violacea]|uniref:DUF3293 domain-containing protein n=1 Tax=Trinickia violacea TaxID=2571746 RepID=A0A4V1EGT8_9BURK|nr:DUF3293 domain-containing protein [Trinickia violacea]QCP47920.1 DUF3293 domain-containing protein [Trinickia violacea]
MFPDSDIPRNTIQAYLETHYHVRGDTPTTLLVGQFNATLAVLHEARRVTASAFVTACNPFSQSLDPEANAARHEELARDLEGQGLTFIEGVGKHPSNDWPAEASFLVLGANVDVAKTLGSRHGQNAIIWCGADAVPQLILLR